MHHTGERPFKCTACDYRSARQDHLTEHIKTHGETGPFVCDECALTAASRAELLAHKNTHIEPSFQCTECDYVTSRRDYLTVHLRRHTGKHMMMMMKKKNPQLFLHLCPPGERPFCCPFCAYAASVKTTLNSHMKSKHPNHDQQQPLITARSIGRSSSTSTPEQHEARTLYVFMCDRCGDRHGTLEELTAHVLADQCLEKPHLTL